MTYHAMGKMLTPDAGIYVGSHVHIPEEDARLDYDGRISFVAPSDTPRRKSVTISLRTIMVISLIAAAVLFIMAQYALAQRRAVINEGRRIASEIVSAENNIESMKKKIADAQDESVIGWQVVHRIGMVSRQGAEVEEIYAPDTRPQQTLEALFENMRAAGQ
ncbi:MAG: hypothetical protein II481_04605 [Clostridia bacterium]|nr:hypothetical protein [Clostridia bacterium]MBR6299484.1 hypothetical protein [Clostridia bacterium]